MSDFRRFYGLSFMECLYVTMGPDEVLSLIRWLPDDSALAASMKGGREHLGWTWDRIVATLLLERAMFHHVDFIRANSSKEAARKINSPDPIPFPGRPEVKRRPKPGSFGPIIKALAAGHKPPDYS